MDQLQSMRIFLRVAELGSFTKAADSMGLTKASVSVAVQKLENLLNTRLLQRTTRQVNMTQDGHQYYQRCKDLLDEMEEIHSLFTREPTQLSGRLRIDLPNAIARNLVIPRLPAFLQRHPKLEVELSSTDRLVDLISEGFDCVLRVGHLRDSNLVARQLGWQQQVNCASPAYIAQYGLPQQLDDLQQHHLIHYQTVLGSRHIGFEYLDATGQPCFQPMPGVLTVNNSDAYLGACLAGIGIIQLPRTAAQPYLDSGELCSLLPDWQAAPLPVSLLYAHRRQLSARNRIFMQWLADILHPYLQTSTAAGLPQDLPE